MSWRTNCFLLAVAVGLSVYAFFFENTAAPWMRLGKHFRDLEPRDIYEIRIEQPRVKADAKHGADARPVLLRHEKYDGWDPAWWVVEPFRSRALHPRVQGICYLIADLTRVAELPEGTPAFAAEGPELVLSFKTRAGESSTIEVGKDHPDPEWDFTYVRVDGETFVTNKEVRKNAQVTVDNLRSRALFPVAAPDAEAFTVARGSGWDGGDFVAKRFFREDAADSWRVQWGATDAAADRELTEEVLKEINAWRVQEFVAEDGSTPASLVAYGLDRPRLELTLERRDGKLIGVDIGRPVPQQAPPPDTTVKPVPLVYARHREQPHVYTVEASLLKMIEKPREAFRSRYILDFGLAEAERVRVKFLRGRRAGTGVDLRELLVKNDDPVWQVYDISGSLLFPGDNRTIEGLLAEQRRLKVERFLSVEEAAAAETGLAEPSVHVEIWTPRGGRMEYFIGAPSDDPLDEGLDVYHMSQPGEPGGYLAVARLFRALEQGAHALRKRDISTLEPLDVLELELHRRDAAGFERRWSVARVPRGEWLLASDAVVVEGHALDGELVEQLLDTLHRDTFRVARYEPDLKDYETLGLERRQPLLGFFVNRVENDRDYEGFRRLVVGNVVAGTDPPQRFARADVEDLPVFTLYADGVPAALDRLTLHLERITVNR